MNVYNKLIYSLILSIIFLASSCADLEVENLNDPDSERALANDSDVIGLLGGGYIQWYQSITATGMIPLMTAADHMTGDVGNFGIRDISWEPRQEFNNSPAYSNSADTNGDLWSRLNSALGTANDVLKVINVDERTLLDETGADQTAMVQASAYLLQGMSLGVLGMYFDQAFILDEFTEVGQAELSPYGEVLDAAVEKLKLCVSTCDEADPFTMTYINGRSYSRDEIKAFAYTMIAKCIAYVGRNKAEDEAVDWAQVAENASKGIQSDFTHTGDGSLWGNFGLMHAYATGAGADGRWIRVDQRIVSLLSTDGLTHEPTQPQRFPVDGQPLPEITGDDRDARLGTDFAYLPGINYNPDRGTYRYSNYRHSRYDDFWNLGFVGEFPITLKAENDLLWAEGLLRSGGSKAVAAELINNSYAVRGGFDALTGSESVEDLLEIVYYERNIELMLTFGALGFIDARRQGVLESFSPGSIPHYPVPGEELLILELPIYTFGG